MSRSSDDQILVKMQFWSSKYFNVQGSNFNWLEVFNGIVLSISENLTSKGQGHNTTKYGQKDSYGLMIPF